MIKALEDEDVRVREVAAEALKTVETWEKTKRNEVTSVDTPEKPRTSDTSTEPGSGEEGGL